MTPLLLLALLGAAPTGAGFAPPVHIDGWTLADPPARYTANTIFDYIDGGAESFLQFDFQDLVAARYVAARKAEMRVEIYRHRDADRAFGMYTQERRPGSTKMPGALEGIASEDHLELVVGAYYVKLALTDGKPSLLPPFAEALAAKLGGRKEPPAVLSLFPARGKLPRAEKLTARDFLGHAFLHDAAAVPYDVDGARFRLFVVQAKDAKEAAGLVGAYRAACKLPAADIPAQGSITFKDPLNGDVLVAWSGRWLWGAVDGVGPQSTALAAELGRNLLRR